ncbi:MAG: hypothetical protein DMF55_11265 [Acidobacteria bacterium]|nr:MAG: hypothetical protein DMF55_11265 [Acidobacteriota bacterium]
MSSPTSSRRDKNLPVSIVGRSVSAYPCRPGAKLSPPIARTERVLRPNGLGSSANTRSASAARKRAASKIRSFAPLPGRVLTSRWTATAS